MDETSESLLARLASNASNDDWQRLMTLYRPFIESQVRAYPHLRDETDDIVQNIVLVLMRELPQFQRQRMGSFRKWFRQVTVNQLRAASRKQRARPIPTSELAQMDLSMDQLLDPLSEASRRWDREHDEEVLRRVVEIVRGQTNPVHWQAFERHALQGEEAQQVADSLGISLNSVKLIKSRVKKRMQTEVQGLL